MIAINLSEVKLREKTLKLKVDICIILKGMGLVLNVWKNENRNNKYF